MKEAVVLGGGGAVLVRFVEEGRRGLPGELQGSEGDPLLGPYRAEEARRGELIVRGARQGGWLERRGNGSGM